MQNEMHGGSKLIEQLSEYQRRVKAVLEVIAELEADRDDCVSETSIYIQTVEIDAQKEHREVLRAAFELIADRGFCSRTKQHWRFHRSFRLRDVPGVLIWNGKWVEPRTNAYSSNR